MKKILIIVILVIMYSSLFSEEKTDENKVKMFTSKSGSLIERTHEIIGNQKGVIVKLIFYTDLISKEKISAVNIETYNNSTNYSTILDAKELDDIIKHLSYIDNNVLSKPITNKNTEVTYTSVGGFKIGCYAKDNQWGVYSIVDVNYSNSFVMMDKGDVKILINLLSDAKSKMI